MRRTTILTLLVVGAFAVAASTAVAAPHFKPPSSGPTCAIDFTSSSSASTTCTASLAGLGNADLLVTTSTSGSAVYTCQNQGGNQAPGQNRVLVGPASSTTGIPAGQIKNGNLTFTTNPAVLTAPTTVTGAVAGCPNNNWTGVNPTLTLTAITLVIEQPPGTVIFSCSATGLSVTSDQTVALSC